MPRIPRPFAGKKAAPSQTQPSAAANQDDADGADYEPPATNLDLSVLMLREAGRIFRALGHENPDLESRMELLAGAYEAVASLTELDPEGEAPDGAENLINF